MTLIGSQSFWYQGSCAGFLDGNNSSSFFFQGSCIGGLDALVLSVRKPRAATGGGCYII